MSLHALLQLQSKIGRAHIALVMAKTVYVRHRRFAGAGRQFGNINARSIMLRNRIGTRATKDDQVEEGVGAQTIRAVHRVGGRLNGVHKTVYATSNSDSHLSRRIQTGHDLVLAILVRQHLSHVVGGSATHVVMNSWKHWNRLFRHIDAGEHLRRFTDA